MNHQLFEEWLLEEKPLLPHEKRLLEAHLRTCQECASLANVNLALRMVKAASPASGFAERFRQRLTAQRKSQRQLAFSGLLLLLLTVSVAFLLVFWPALHRIIISPGEAIISWVSLLVSLWSVCQALLEVSQVLFRVLSGYTSSGSWALTFLVMSSFCTLGVTLLSRLIRLPQGVKT